MFKKITTNVVWAKLCNFFKRLLFKPKPSQHGQQANPANLLHEVLRLCKSEIKLTRLRRRLKLVTVLLLFTSGLKAQQKDAIIPLQIGNKVPAWVMDATFPVLRNQGAVYRV
jgi:hypothetical protein